MGLCVAFSGPSNSGKTTLIVKLIQKFRLSNLKVSVLKHDPKDKSVFDTIGKDSYNFFSAGANVVVSSPQKTVYFFNQEQSMHQIIKNLGEFDIFLVEGLKTWPLPRISLFRGKIDIDYLPFSQAIALDNECLKTLNYNENCDLNRFFFDKFGVDKDVFKIDDVDKICDWILKNGKRMEY